MNKPIVLKAKNYDDMESIAVRFIHKGYKVMSEDGVHIIAKKRNLGSRYVHLLFLFLILFIVSYNSFIIYITCGLYIVYFMYYLFKKAEIVLITTENTDENGDPIEFDNIDELAILHE